MSPGHWRQWRVEGGGRSIKSCSEESQQLLDKLRIVGALFQQAGFVRQAFLFLRRAIFRRATRAMASRSASWLTGLAI